MARRSGGIAVSTAVLEGIWPSGDMSELLIIMAAMESYRTTQESRQSVERSVIPAFANEVCCVEEPRV